ncbi:MAG: DNA polymerase III subunit [Candidatus Coatesbacteria bacterium]
MKLPRVLGQPHAVRCLTTASAPGATGHAYLFYGPPGVGKRTAALAFARALNCENPPGVGDCCEKCGPCVEIGKGIFAEVRFVAPEDDSGKARTFHTEQISDAIHWATRTAHVRRTKVAIMEDAHLMSAEAANHFLKILEEPPDRTVWILLAPDRDAVLPTLRSRCLPVRFTLLSREAIEGIFRLREKGAADTAPMEEASALCLGRLDVPPEEIQASVREAEAFLGLAERFDLPSLEALATSFARKDEAERLPGLLDGLERACAARLRLHAADADRWVEALDAVGRARWRWRNGMGKTMVDALGAELSLALKAAGT